MNAGGPTDDDKPYVDSERPDAGIAGGGPAGERRAGDKPHVDSERPEAGIGSLPSNATEPFARPKGTEERGDSGAGAPEPSDRLPPAGPHADPDLINPDATPGTGALQPPGGHDDVDSTSG